MVVATVQPLHPRTERIGRQRSTMPDRGKVLVNDARVGKHRLGKAVQSHIVQVQAFLETTVPCPKGGGVSRR